MRGFAPCVDDQLWSSKSVHRSVVSVEDSPWGGGIAHLGDMSTF